VRRFEAMSFSPAACRANAERFSEAAFRAAMQDLVEAVLPAVPVEAEPFAPAELAPAMP
jgi:hypothetical protein